MGKKSKVDVKGIKEECFDKTEKIIIDVLSSAFESSSSLTLDGFHVEDFYCAILIWNIETFISSQTFSYDH